MDMATEIEKLRNTCIGCGRCSAVCPALKHGGIDPMEVMMGGEADMSTCIMCGNCSRICRRSNPGVVMKNIIAMEGGIHVSQLFRDTGYVMQPLEEVPEPRWSGDDVKVMPGCVTKGKVPYVNYAASVAMSAIGVGACELPGNTCCMHPVQFREMSQMERTSYQRKMGANADGKPIVALCAGCSEELIDAAVDAEHIIPFLHRHLDRLPRLARPMKVGMEPGCSAEPFRKEMRAVLEAMGCEIVNREFGCCGKSTPLGPALMDDREAECAGAEWIVVGCPMCLVKYDAREGGIPTMHIAELVAMAAGDTESLGFHALKGPSD